MHLRICLWLSYVVLAGYVRATEESGAAAVASNGIEAPTPVKAETSPVDRSSEHHILTELYLDDEAEGSGGRLDPNADLESSGSGWGPDDEDGPGSGSTIITLPTGDDDEDHPIAEGDDFDDNMSGFDTKPTSVVVVGEPRGFDVTSSSNAKKTQPEISVPQQPRDPIEPEVPKVHFVDTSNPDINISNEDDALSPEQDIETGPQGNPSSNVVYIMNKQPEDRASSFFAQPGMLAAVLGGAVVGLLCAILGVMFIVYRMRKKDEGSYALDEPKRSPAAASYGKGHNNREFYA